jgi:hypothetical protein
MSRRLLKLAFCCVTLLSCAAFAFGQTPQQPTQPQPIQTQPSQPVQKIVTTQTAQAVQNPDGTWTVIQYPADKEVVIDFTPAPTFSTAKGHARIMRTNDNTTIALDLAGLPADAAALNLYTVDSFGKVSLLGPVAFKDGIATQSYTTPLDKFMLVLSPDANLTAYAPTTAFAFRSAVPQGFAVVPLSSTDRSDGAPVGEKVSATSTSGATTGYMAPMLNVPGMKVGSDTEVKVNLAGALTGSRVNFNITPRKDGPTVVVARFHELKEAPAGKVYVLWAISPDNKYVKLGQVVNTGARNEAEIKSETTLPDFGLLITLEDEVSTPTGIVVGTVVP